MNLLMEVAPAKATPILFGNLFSKLRSENIVADDSDFIPIIESLRKLGYFAWAYHVLHWSITDIGLTP